MYLAEVYFRIIIVKRPFVKRTALDLRTGG